jgi:hypothetical protein
MEQHALKNVNNCLNTNIYFYLDTSGGNGIKLFLSKIYVFLYKARVFWNGLEKLVRNKHSILLQKFVNYGQIKFYNIWPWWSKF